MRIKVALLVGALALAAVPAMALAAPSGKRAENGKGSGKKADPTPGPKAGLNEKAKAYGRYCKGASRKHEKGEKGTEFSRCVTRMAQAANHERMAAKKACRGLSKKHVEGEKGTEFSRCVKGVAQLRREEKREQRREHREEREAEREEEAEEGESKEEP